MITLDYIESVQHHSGEVTKALVPLLGEIRINCPECNDDKFHCYCNMDKMLYHCFKCGAGGKIQREYKPDVKDYSKIIEMNPIFDPGKFAKEATKQVKNLPHCDNIYGNDATPYSPHDNAYMYLVRRGVTQEEIKEYDIKVSLDKSGIYKNTIIFPIYGEEVYYSKELGGQLREKVKGLSYFVARKYDDSKPKYVNAPWPKDGTFFTCAGHNPTHTVLVEGILDALAVSRVGYFSAAILGKQLTAKQLVNKKVIHPNGRYIIYLDEDALLNAVNLKLQLMAMDIKCRLIYNDVDAAEEYMRDENYLREILDEASKHLASIKE